MPPPRPYPKVLHAPTFHDLSTSLASDIEATHALARLYREEQAGRLTWARSPRDRGWLITLLNPAVPGDVTVRLYQWLIEHRAQFRSASA